MPELRPHHDPAGVMATPPSPRAVLFWDGTYWRAAAVDAAGHIQIDVLSTVMDAAAATAAAQALALAQLQTIAEIRDALQSVATDRLIVRGEDQLFSYQGALLKSVTGAISGANGHFSSVIVPAGEVWAVTNIVAVDQTTACTEIQFTLWHAAGTWYFGNVIRAIGANERVPWSGHLYLDPDDRVWVYFIGGLGGDTCRIDLTGYIMTPET